MYNRRFIEQNIKPLDLSELTKRTGNIYKAVAIMGKRANIISKQLKKELRAQLDEFGPAVTSNDTMDEIIENREQIEISRLYEQLPKPTLIALNDFMNDKIKIVREESGDF
jgi:DNA-directed RNA polymerase subunit K/omega